MKVCGVWSYMYRAVDQHGQVIDVYVSRRRDIAAARTFFIGALAVHGDPAEVITDRAPALANVIEDLVPAAYTTPARTRTTALNAITAGSRLDCGRCGVKTNRTANAVIRGHAFIQNLRRGRYELAVDAAPLLRLATALDELRPAAHAATGDPEPPEPRTDPAKVVACEPKARFRSPAGRLPCCVSAGQRPVSSSAKHSTWCVIGKTRMILGVNAKL